MNSSSNYKSIKEILTSLNQSIDALEGGALNVEQLEGVLQDARELHERIAILQYMSILPKGENTSTSVENNVDKDPAPVKKSMNFQFAFDDSEPIVPTNQTSLLDAIQEEEIPEQNLKAEENIAPKPPVDEVKAPDEEVTLNEKLEDQQKETLNDKFSEQTEKVSLAEKLGKKPIPDLVKAIGLNQKFLFMNDLFEGENNHYKEAINNLNNFASFIEADEYINTLRSRHNWEITSNTVKEFVELVERRYS